MDFTLRKYAELCAALLENDFRSLSMGEYLGGKAPTGDERIVLLRHDVDSRPRHALEMGKIEGARGLKATYFFRMVGSAYDPDVIRAMGALGHEIGYHYETLARSRGDMPRALALFREELARLRQLALVQVAAMHGSPLSRYDNRAIWEHASPADFDLLGEVYRDIDYRRVMYFNDTGRTWNPTRYNVRDSTGSINLLSADSTDELIALLADQRLRQVCLSTHPERWQDNKLAWGMQLGRDVAINSLKVLLKRWYAQKK